jgi:cytochrome c
MKKLLIVFGIASAMVACTSSADKKAGETTEPKAADTVAATPPAIAGERGLELIGANDCTTCHQIDKKNIGPAYIDVSKKYEATDAVIDTLVNKVISGGSGNWGTVPMTPHPNLSKDDAREMVKYILNLKNQKP